MKFNLICDDNDIIIYDNIKNDFDRHYTTPPVTTGNNNYNKSFVESDPRKTINKLQLVFGYACNYDCAYCSQRLNHERNPGTQNVDQWIKILNSINNQFQVKQQIELWGGEPLIYWKLIRRLLPTIRNLWPNVTIFITTNGSLLTQSIVDDFIKFRINVQISHDGPAQTIIRNKNDILDDPNIKSAIQYILDNQMPITFHPVISRYNCDLRKLYSWFYTRYPDIEVVPEGVVMCYNYNINEINQPFNELEQSTFIESFLEMSKVRFDNDRKLYGIWNDIDDFLARLGKQKIAGCTCYGPNKLAVDFDGKILRCHTENPIDSKLLGNITSPVHFFDHKQDVMYMKNTRTGFCNNSCISWNTCAGCCPVVPQSRFDERYCINQNMVTFALLVTCAHILWNKNIISITTNE